MKVGVQRISKRHFYNLGGFANSQLFRRQRYGYWEYYIDWRV